MYYNHHSSKDYKLDNYFKLDLFFINYLWKGTLKYFRRSNATRYFTTVQDVERR